MQSIYLNKVKVFKITMHVQKLPDWVSFSLYFAQSCRYAQHCIFIKADVLNRQCILFCTFETHNPRLVDQLPHTFAHEIRFTHVFTQAKPLVNHALRVIRFYRGVQQKDLRLWTLKWQHFPPCQAEDTWLYCVCVFLIFWVLWFLSCCIRKLSVHEK